MGTRGRPTTGTNALAELALQARSPQVQMLFAQAARMGHGLLSFAKAVGKEPKTLRDLAEKTRNPRPETLRAYVAALGFQSYVARALCDALSQNDRDDIRAAIRAKVWDDCLSPAKIVARLDASLDALSAEDRKNVLVTFALAQSGFREPPRSPWSWASDELSMLSPGLLAVDIKLEALGSDLRLRDHVDKTAERVLKSDEAKSALRFLKYLQRLSDAKRKQVFEQMYRIAMGDD